MFGVKVTWCMFVVVMQEPFDTTNPLVPPPPGAGAKVRKGRGWEGMG